MVPGVKSTRKGDLFDLLSLFLSRLLCPVGFQCCRAVRATGETQYVEGVFVFMLGGHVHPVCR